MKIAVAAVLCLTVVAVVAANQRKGCAERGGECKSVQRDDQTCPGGVRKLDCSGRDRCCLSKGHRNQVKSTKRKGGKKDNGNEIRDKKKKNPGEERSGKGRTPNSGDGKGRQKAIKGDRNGNGNRQGKGHNADRPRNAKKAKGPENGKKDGVDGGGNDADRPRSEKGPGKPRNGRKPNQRTGKPKNGRKPNQNDQGGRGDKRRGGKGPNKDEGEDAVGKSKNGMETSEDGEEGDDNKNVKGGKEAGKRLDGKPNFIRNNSGDGKPGKPVHTKKNSGRGKPPSLTEKNGGSVRQTGCRVKKQCKQLRGKCQSASSTCKGQSYTGSKFCTGSCSCCVKNNQVCRPKNKCKKKNGTCQFKWDSCDGQKLKRACKGSSSTCVCCAPRSCKDKNNLCSAAGGSCVLKGATCPGQVDSSLCGKFCQCCLVGPSPIPSTLAPTPKPPSPTTAAPPPPSVSPEPPTNSATEIHTATAAPPTTTVCNVSRAYCVDCGIATIDVADYRIVNGLNASQDEFPYQVIVRPIIKGLQYQCGGSIIKKRWVLTAAHCFFDRNGNQPAQNGVVVGYGNINRHSTTDVTSTRYIVHEKYDASTSANDIALIELPSNLNYETDPAIQPICLAVESDIPYGGKAVATGWGTLVYQGTNLPSILQEVTLDIITISHCKTLESLPPDTSTVVCALTPTKDTCQGDSGGPLVAKVCPNKWVQIGIVSYGVGCAFPNSPGIYTRVSAFRHWIDVNTGSSTSC